MSNRTCCVLALSSLLLTACTGFGLPPAPYNPGRGEGYGSTMFGYEDACDQQVLSSSSCRVGYVADVFSGMDIAFQYAIRRAAEVGHQHKFAFVALGAPEFTEISSAGTRGIRVRMRAHYFRELPRFDARPAGVGQLYKVELVFQGKQIHPEAKVQEAWIVSMREYQEAGKL